MKKTLIMCVLLSVLLLPAFVFAAGQQEAAEAKPKEFSIYWATNHRYETYDKVFEEFAAENNLKLNAQYFSWTEFSPKIKADFAAGTPPDVIEVPAPWIAEFANIGQLTDLTDRVKSWDDYEQFFESTWVETSLNGRIYGMKLHHTCFGMYYNQEQLQQAGLDPQNPPKNIDEFIAASNKISDKLDPVKGFAFDPSAQYLISFIANSENPFIIDDNNRVAFDIPSVRKTMRKLHDLARSDAVIVPEAGGEQAHFSHRQLFINEKTSFFISGPWDIKNIKKGNPEMDYSVFGVPHLKGTDPRYLVAGTAGGVPKAAENVDLGFELLARIASLETQVQATLETGMLYPRKDWANDPRVQDTPGVQFFGPLLPKATPWDTPVKKLGLPEVTWGGYLFDKLYQSLVYSDEPIDKAFDEYVREANKLLAEKTE
jgi:multiple sugar transport system substrate-binding protein